MRGRDFIVMGAGEAIEVGTAGARGPAASDEIAYRENERPVMAMLATRYSELERDARRELYHEAWASVAIAREVERLWRINAAAIGTGDPDMLPAGSRLRLA